MSKNDITVLLVEDELTLAMIIKDTLEGKRFYHPYRLRRRRRIASFL